MDELEELRKKEEQEKAAREKADLSASCLGDPFGADESGNSLFQNATRPFCLPTNGSMAPWCMAERWTAFEIARAGIFLYL